MANKKPRFSLLTFLRFNLEIENKKSTIMVFVAIFKSSSISFIS